MKLNNNFFSSWDGTSIIYRSWNQGPNTKGIVLLLHRGHEHSGRMESMAEFFVEDNYTVYAWDARGNGLSEGARDDAESFSVFAKDFQCFVDLIIQETQRPSQDIFLIASSMGAVIAASWVHDYAPSIRGMILATPAFNIRLYMPFAIPMLTFLRQFSLLPKITSYVKSKVLTHDRAEQAIYNQDPLISGSIATDLLIDTYQTGQRIIDDADAINTPTLVLCAGKDWVVSRSAQRKFYNKLSSTKKQWVYFPDLFHAIFHEDKKQAVFETCQHFMNDCFSQPHVDVDNSESHKYGHSKDKMESFLLPSLNPLYPITKLVLSSIGRLSHSIQLGLKYGFDSGRSLDNIYTNEAKGKSVIGKMIDRIYLDSPGWKGIRCRKKLILSLLTKYIGTTKPFHVLDIASGNGRYLFDLMQSNSMTSVEMRDFDEGNVGIMASKIKGLALDSRATAIQSDAFSLASYKDKEIYDFSVASGIFELFSDNQLISTALEGIVSQLKPGGYFLYTNQPWHPQQEFIARTLNNHQGKPWIMRCRSQSEMDNLIKKSGLEKIDMGIDPSGIFTVSIAQKRVTN